MEILNDQQGESLIKNLLEKVWESPEFKEQLINNPSKTMGNFIGRELDCKLPNGKELVVVDQSDESKYYLNIPVNPRLNFELSEQELDMVAGGGCSVKQAGIDTANWIEDRVDDLKDWWNSGGCLNT